MHGAPARVRAWGFNSRSDSKSRAGQSPGGWRSLLVHALRDASQRFRPDRRTTVSPPPTTAGRERRSRVRHRPLRGVGRVPRRSAGRSSGFFARQFRTSCSRSGGTVDGARLRRWRRGRLKVLSEHLHHGVAFEDLPAGQEVVGDAPERIRDPLGGPPWRSARSRAPCSRVFRSPGRPESRVNPRLGRSVAGFTRPKSSTFTKS